jgi:hypothetical protein
MSVDAHCSLQPSAGKSKGAHIWEIHETKGFVKIEISE